MRVSFAAAAAAFASSSIDAVELKYFRLPTIPLFNSAMVPTYAMPMMSPIRSAVSFNDGPYAKIRFSSSVPLELVNRFDAIMPFASAPQPDMKKKEKADELIRAIRAQFGTRAASAAENITKKLPELEALFPEAAAGGKK